MKPDDIERELAYLRLQARWTRPMRIQLLRKIGLTARKRILDAGCADGYLTAEIVERTSGTVVGIDISETMIEHARAAHPDVEFRVADFEKLPFKKGEFDAVITSFTLMWTRQPNRALREAFRVLAPGGVVLATGEPDYGGRIDEPNDLTLGPLWAEAITRGGGDPFFGRKLKRHLVGAGFRSVDVGVMPSVWEGAEAADFVTYADALRHFLTGTAKDIERIIEKERRAHGEGNRLVFMPIFWGMGTKA
jgi:ubiquinone/menaquinone biosynthesis C-methylase UbiE